MLFTPSTFNTIAIVIAYGLRASGKFRTDTYFFSTPDTWDNKKIENVCAHFEKITGLKVLTFKINAPKSKRAPKNIVRHVLYSGNTPIPLRFKPIIDDNKDFLKE